MTQEARLKLEKKAARLLVKSQKAAEKALKEEQSTDLVKLPSFRLGRVTGGLRPSRPMMTKPPRRSIRVAAADGTIPFHMRISSVSKAAPTEAAGLVGAGTAAAAHQLYVEREQALEEMQIERGRATVAEATQDYIEREGAVASSFGSIADTLEERVAFWGAIDDAERTPHQHVLRLTTDDDARLTAIAAALPADAPRPLVDLLEKRVPVIVDTKAMREISRFIRDQAIDDAVSIQEGRGGVVQRRLVLELPADMTPVDRYHIAAKFCEEAFAAHGVRYHCAIHAPTPKNDDRNHHFHVAFYDRPTDRVRHPETNELVWDFEVVESYKAGSGNKRERRPLRQPKTKIFDARGWPKATRELYCRIVNERRAAVGRAPIYHPTTYEAAGVDVEPVPQLTRMEFHDLQRGVDNPVALATIAKRWERLALLEVAPEGSLLRREETEAEQTQAPTKAKKAPDLVALTRRKAPASIVAAQVLVGDRSITEARRADVALERSAVRIVITEIERGNLLRFPRQIDDQARRRILDDLERRLLAGVAKEDRALVQHLANLDAREAKMRVDLANMRPWDLSLPTQSLGDLAGRASLGNVVTALDAKNAAVATAARRAARAPRPDDAIIAPAADTQELPILDAASIPTVAAPIAPTIVIEEPVSAVQSEDRIRATRNARAVEIARKKFGAEIEVLSEPIPYYAREFTQFAGYFGEDIAIVQLNRSISANRTNRDLQRDHLRTYYTDKPSLRIHDDASSVDFNLPYGVIRPKHFPEGTVAHRDHPDHAIPSPEPYMIPPMGLRMVLKSTPEKDRADVFIKFVEERENDHWLASATKRELDRLSALKAENPTAYEAERIPLPLYPGETYDEMLEHRRVQAARDLEIAALEKRGRELDALIAKDSQPRIAGEETALDRYVRFNKDRDAEIERRENERRRQDARDREAARLRDEKRVAPATPVDPLATTPKPRPGVPITQPAFINDPEIERLAQENRDRIARRRAEKLAAEETARLAALTPKPMDAPIVTDRQTTRPAPSDAIASTTPTVSKPKTETATTPKHPADDTTPTKTIDRAAESKRAGIIAAKKRRPKGRGR